MIDLEPAHESIFLERFNRVYPDRVDWIVTFGFEPPLNYEDSNPNSLAY